MFTTAFDFLLNTLLGLLTIAFLLRCFLQLTGAPFHNPFSQAIVTLTNFAVRPVRRIIPAWKQIDTASLLLAYLTQLLLFLLLLWVHDFPVLVAGSQVLMALFGLALIGVIKQSLYLMLYAVILQAIMSWINPHTPLAPVLNSLTRPVLNPLRRIMPNTGGLDLTPIIVFILIQLILIAFISPLEQSLTRLF